MKKGPATKSIQMTAAIPSCQPAVSPEKAISPEIVYRTTRLRLRVLVPPVLAAECVFGAARWRGGGGGLRR